MKRIARVVNQRRESGIQNAGIVRDSVQFITLKDKESPSFLMNF